MQVRFQQVNINGVKFKLNSILKTQLEIMKKTVRNDFDAIFIVDGEIEGSGKSVLAQQCALYCDPTLSVDRIVFTPLEFKKAVLNADKYQSVIWDEAYEGGNKFAIFSAVNQMIRSLLRQIRQKNLIIFIVIPAITDLDYDIAVRRSWALIRAELRVDYDALEIKRGHFSFYSRKKKRWIYYIEGNRMDLKKGYKCGNSFVGFFENVYGVNKQLYLEKKSEIRVNSLMDERTFIEECIKRGMNWSNIQEYVSYSRRHFYRIKQAVTGD